MNLEIVPCGPEALPRYAQVPIAFQVRSVLRACPVDGGLGGIVLREEPVEPPYWKDYDAYEGGPPTDWPRQFNLRNWGFFLALADGRPVGAAAVARDTPGVRMLAGRHDMGVLWDIRVHPDFRGRRIGKALFWHAVAWSRQHGCRLLKIETQDVNVPACRFYHAQGCTLGQIDRYGYIGVPQVAHEVMLVWYLEL